MRGVSVQHQFYDIDVAVISRGFVCLSHSLKDLQALFSDPDLHVDPFSGNVLRFVENEGGFSSPMNIEAKQSPLFHMESTPEDGSPQENSQDDLLREIRRAEAQEAANNAQVTSSGGNNDCAVQELYLYVPEYTVAFLPGMTKLLVGFTDAKDPNVRHIARSW